MAHGRTGGGLPVGRVPTRCSRARERSRRLAEQSRVAVRMQGRVPCPHARGQVRTSRGRPTTATRPCSCGATCRASSRASLAGARLVAGATGQRGQAVGYRAELLVGGGRRDSEGVEEELAVDLTSDPPGAPVVVAPTPNEKRFLLNADRSAYLGNAGSDLYSSRWRARSARPCGSTRRSRVLLTVFALGAWGASPGSSTATCLSSAHRHRG